MEYLLEQTQSFLNKTTPAINTEDPYNQKAIRSFQDQVLSHFVWHIRLIKGYQPYSSTCILRQQRSGFTFHLLAHNDESAVSSIFLLQGGNMNSVTGERERRKKVEFGDQN